MQTSNKRLKSIDRSCKHLGEKVSPEFLASCIKKQNFAKVLFFQRTFVEGFPKDVWFGKRVVLYWDIRSKMVFIRRVQGKLCKKRGQLLVVVIHRYLLEGLWMFLCLQNLRQSFAGRMFSMQSFMSTRMPAGSYIATTTVRIFAPFIATAIPQPIFSWDFHISQKNNSALISLLSLYFGKKKLDERIIGCPCLDQQRSLKVRKTLGYYLYNYPSV